LELGVGAGCHEDPVVAARKALLEGGAVRWVAPGALEPPSAEKVRTPLDHLAYQRTPRAREARAFLASSEETVDIRDVHGRPGPAAAAAEAIGNTLLIDLSSPATRPFRVARALVPGLLPLTFGYDREPLGMRRLSGPLTTADGRRLGSTLELERAGPIMPHPFP
jgi:ribosomal protein S12 methylthiotransferase accessory factor YcaO